MPLPLVRCKEVFSWERILLQAPWEPHFSRRMRLSVQVRTSASAHSNIWAADKASVAGLPPCPLPPPCWGFHFGVLPCLGKRNFTGPRTIPSVIEGLELLIPKEGSLCWEKASSEPSDLRVLTNPCSPSLLRAADTGFQAIQGSARDFWGAWLVA